MVAASAHLALVAVEDQRRLHVVGERRESGPRHQSTLSSILPLAAGPLSFHHLLLERQSLPNPYLSFFYSRSVDLTQPEEPFVSQEPYGQPGCFTPSQRFTVAKSREGFVKRL